MSIAHSGPVTRSPSRRVVLALAALALVGVGLAIGWMLGRSDGDSGAIQGSGVAVVATRAVPPFSSVELVGANEVSIGVGSDQSVVVRGDDNLVGLVTTEVANGVLVVDASGSFQTASPMSVEITVPSLEDVRLSGNGSIAIDGHELESLRLALPGTGTIVGAGSVTELDVDLSGLGTVDVRNLVARDASVVMPGTGTVFVHVTGTLSADVAGVGSVVYTGGPDRIEQSVTGTGSVVEG
jgi:hypothetical protein